MADYGDRHLNLMRTLEAAEPCAPTMPLTHCTKSEYFFDMIREGAISKRPCKVFGEELVYLFYGRPSYRPYAETANTSLDAFRPVALLFRPEAIAAIRRIHPFDTGAFANGLYGHFIPGHARMQNYEIRPDLEAASKSVSFFFGSNRNYYLGRTAPGASAPPANPTVSSLLGMFQARGLSEVDDRRSAIEVQVAADVKLDSDAIMAICLPSDYCEDDSLLALITEDWKADIIGYDIYHDSPMHDMREVMARVKDYLEAKALL